MRSETLSPGGKPCPPNCDTMTSDAQDLQPVNNGLPPMKTPMPSTDGYTEAQTGAASQDHTLEIPLRFFSEHDQAHPQCHGRLGARRGDAGNYQRPMSGQGHSHLGQMERAGGVGHYTAIRRVAHLHPPQEESGAAPVRDAVGNRGPAFSLGVADPHGGNPLAAAGRAVPGPRVLMKGSIPSHLKPSAQISNLLTSLIISNTLRPCSSLSNRHCTR